MTEPEVEHVEPERIVSDRHDENEGARAIGPIGKLYDYSITRLSCCTPVVGCGCAVVIVLPVLGIIGGTAAYALMA